MDSISQIYPLFKGIFVFILSLIKEWRKMGLYEVYNCKMKNILEDIGA
ncbi:MAG: hypothetical protein IJE43_22600 [Alphaproteobacteria bacterium]|nr:hypothetical protein [Alphaproteobacteria bacterium]